MAGRAGKSGGTENRRPEPGSAAARQCRGVAGMLSGMISVFIWDKSGITASLAGELIIPGMFPAFFISLFCIIIVSLYTVPPNTKKLFN